MVIVLLVVVVTVILGVAVVLVFGVTSIAGSKCNAYCPYITYGSCCQLLLLMVVLVFIILMVGVFAVCGSGIYL